MFAICEIDILATTGLWPTLDFFLAGSDGRSGSPLETFMELCGNLWKNTEEHIGEPHQFWSELIIIVSKVIILSIIIIRGYAP